MYWCRCRWELTRVMLAGPACIAVSGAMGAPWHLSYVATQISVATVNTQIVRRMTFPFFIRPRSSPRLILI